MTDRPRSDTTDTEQRLRDSEQRMRLAAEITGLGFWEWHLATDSVRWDRQMFTIYGAAPTADGLVDYAVWRAAVVPDDLPEQEKIKQETLRRRGQSRREFRIRRLSDGAQRIIESIETVRLDTEGNPEWMVGTNIDITDRKHLECALRESEERFRSLFDYFPDPSWVIDEERVLECNHAALATLGYPDKASLGNSHLSAFSPEYQPDGERTRDKAERMMRIAREQGVHRFDWLHTNRNGGEFCVEVTLSSIVLQGRPVFYASWRDITERKAAESSLRQSEEKLRTILDSVDAYIYLKDLQGHYLFANLPVRRWWRMQMEDIVGFGDEKFFDAETVANIRHNDRQVLVDGKTVRTEETNSIPETGESSTFLSVKMPLRSEDGSIYALCGISTDITERKRLEEELVQHRDHLEELVENRTQELKIAKRQAESASVSKSAFLANMSHEIRTPLNAILGLSHMIRRGGLTPKQTEQINKLETASDHLLSTINTILELSKIEAGKFDLDETEVAINSLIHNIVTMLDDRIKAKELNLVTDIDPLPPHLLGDPTRLQQAILNYASNALKFTETGYIALRVKCLEPGVESVMLRFEVEDTGIGIARDVLLRLFSAFEQANDDRQRDYGGTGLGLAITKKLAQLMGGDAGAESSPGRGSTFWFTARLKRVVAAEVESAITDAQATVDSLKANSAGMRVLIVDDEPLNREVAVFSLENFDLIIDTANDGEEAVALADAVDYSLILMDMRMPKMGGIEATQRIRALRKTQQPAIIAMTANAFREDIERCLAGGMDDFIAKPFPPDELVKIVGKWLAKISA